MLMLFSICVVLCLIKEWLKTNGATICTQTFLQYSHCYTLVSSVYHEQHKCRTDKLREELGCYESHLSSRQETCSCNVIGCCIQTGLHPADNHIAAGHVLPQTQARFIILSQWTVYPFVLYCPWVAKVSTPEGAVFKWFIVTMTVIIVCF